MTERWLYYVEWYEDEPGRAVITQAFALTTSRPDYALKKILESSFARAIRGPVKNFSGPNGKVLCD
jgi:hypothetical protein